MSNDDIVWIILGILGCGLALFVLVVGIAVVWVEYIEPWYDKRKLLKRIKKLPKYTIVGTCEYKVYSMGDTVYRDNESFQGYSCGTFYDTNGIRHTIYYTDIEEYKIKKILIGGKLILKEDGTSDWLNGVKV